MPGGISAFLKKENDCCQQHASATGMAEQTKFRVQLKKQAGNSGIQHHHRNDHKHTLFALI